MKQKSKTTNINNNELLLIIIFTNYFLKYQQSSIYT